MKCLTLIITVFVCSLLCASASDAPASPVSPPAPVEPIPAPVPPSPSPAADTPAPTPEAPKPKRSRRAKAAEDAGEAEEFDADEILLTTRISIAKLEAEIEANATNVRARNAAYHLREALPHLRELIGGS